MEAINLLIFLSLLLLAGKSVADFVLDSFPSSVSIGGAYSLRWTATDNYTYTIWLVADSDADENESAYGWKKVSSLGTGLTFSSLEPTYSWVVPSNISVDGSYALWLNGFNIPFDGAGNAVVTDWFSVSSRAPSSSASSTPSATSDAASETSTSSRDSSGTQRNGLSGGAIAGIVIGCILLIGLVVGAALFFRRRRNRSTPESREATARANRLAPVMQENFPGYEMHTRGAHA